MPSLDILNLIAAGLCSALGLAHSYLGERYILMRLFRLGNLPKLFDGTEFTERTLRFAWHLTSVAWWGFAALFFQLAKGPISSTTVSAVLAGVSLISAAVAFLGSRGRHFRGPSSWSSD